MAKTWVPKEIAGVRIPKEVRRAGARLSKSGRSLVLAALAPAILAGIFAGLRAARSSGPGAS